jgi:hypothetical protein
MGVFEQSPEKVKQEFLSHLFFSYFRLLPYDFLFKKANQFIDIDQALTFIVNKISDLDTSKTLKHSGCIKLMRTRTR